jgi:hypothetical protein
VLFEVCGALLAWYLLGRVILRLVGAGNDLSLSSPTKKGVSNFKPNGVKICSDSNLAQYRSIPNDLLEVLHLGAMPT